jgi:BMFP domain-containing protein YqiC
MEKYNKFLRNVSGLIEKGLFSSRDLKKQIEDIVKIKLENAATRLNLVSREEFEIQKKIVENLKKDLIETKKKKIIEVTSL